MKLKRPYATRYYRTASDHELQRVGHGAALTEEGAIRGAVVRVFIGQYAKAIIFDRATGVPMYHVLNVAGGIRIRYGSGIEYKQFKVA